MSSIFSIPMPYRIGIKHIKSVVLEEVLYLEQWEVPVGVMVRTFQTKNFGHVVLPEGCKDRRGFVIPKRIFSV